MAYADPERARQYHREHSKRWMKEQADRRRAAGWCVYCGLVDVSRSKYAACLQCRESRQRMQHLRNQRKRVPCVRCGQPRTPRTRTGLCFQCKLHDLHAGLRKSQPRHCPCGRRLCRVNVCGLCRSCNARVQKRHLRNQRPT